VKRPPILGAFLGDEIIADSFAGGGGASTGIELALGRSPDLAINHDAEALAMHAANHPTTEHRIESVWAVDPVEACHGKRVALAWFSPDCKHHSKAKGGKPREQKIRGLAWVAVRWAQAVRPRVIALENVEEFRDWGPLDRSGMPIKNRKGQTFRAFVSKLERLGYVVEHRLLKACDYGAPTTRRRLFLIARCDGLPIMWPAATHGRGRATPHRTAAECIDWSVPCPSIFSRERPLADKTLARIARGVRKYVLESAQPFLLHLTHGTRDHDIESPVPTVTGAHRGELALAIPYLVHRSNGERVGQAPRIYDVSTPLGTIVAQGQKHALCAAFLARHYGGNENNGHPVTIPMSTITTQDHHAVVTCEIERTDGRGASPDRFEGDRDPNRGDGMADSQSKRDDVQRSSQDRSSDEARVPRRESDRERKPIRDRSAPASLDGDARRDSTSDGREPHRREQAQQLPLQLGATDAQRKHLARVPNWDSNGDRRSGGAGGPVQGTPRAGDVILADREGDGSLANDGVPSRAFLVASFLSRYNGQSVGQQVDLPLSTVDTHDRFGLVTVVVDGEEYAIVDIGMRMLTPRELFRAQGFADSYVIDGTGPSGKALTKTAQIRMCGNSVCPPLAAAIVRAQFAGERTMVEAA
jgi:DNA (cytosine-5)-methyltransferase 1